MTRLWSQEKLAAHLAQRWGKEVTQQYVSYRLRLGRFLSFFTTSGCEDWKIPADLTERRFRTLWEETEASGNFSGHRANTEAAKLDTMTAAWRTGNPLRIGPSLRRSAVGTFTPSVALPPVATEGRPCEWGKHPGITGDVPE